MSRLRRKRYPSGHPEQGAKGKKAKGILLRAIQEGALAGLSKLLRSVAMVLVLTMGGQVAGTKEQHDCHCACHQGAVGRQERAACYYGSCKKEVKKREVCDESYEHDEDGC